MTEPPDRSLGARWDHVMEEWGLEAGFAVLALAIALIFILDDSWWAVVSKVLVVLLWVPLSVRIVRAFRQGWREAD